MFGTRISDNGVVGMGTSLRVVAWDTLGAIVGSEYGGRCIEASVEEGTTEVDGMSIVSKTTIVGSSD